MKDNFSSVSSGYAKFRPGYPAELFSAISNLCKNHSNAWDCGTGNGQFAVALLNHFEKVYATDISRHQLDQAQHQDKIAYSLQPAEKTDFPDSTFDLITVAQAIHWFNFERFYKEVRRTMKKNGILAVAGYGLFRVNPAIDKLIDHFYEVITGPYWDKERRYLDEGYQTIPFPFEEIELGNFEINLQWNIDHVKGYLNTWSAVSHYKKEKEEDPVALILPELMQVWKDVKPVSIPVFTRIGRVF